MCLKTAKRHVIDIGKQSLGVNIVEGFPNIRYSACTMHVIIQIPDAKQQVQVYKNLWTIFESYRYIVKALV